MSQGIGVVLTVFRRSVTLASTFAQRRMLVTLEIPSKDRSYPWFLEWMAIHAPQPQPTSISSSSAQQQQTTGGGIASLWKGKQPMSLRSHELAVETTYKQHENGASEAVFNLVPGPGTHYFKFRGSWFQVSRSCTTYLASGVSSGDVPYVMKLTQGPRSSGSETLNSWTFILARPGRH